MRKIIIAVVKVVCAESDGRSLLTSTRGPAIAKAYRCGPSRAAKSLDRRMACALPGPRPRAA